VIEQKGGGNEITIMMDKINKMEKEMKEQNAQMKEMKKIINSQNKIINTNNYEKCNVTQNEKCNITQNIIAFGKEDLSFISDDEYKRILNKGFGAPKAFTEYVHFNKDKPEHQNMYIANKKDTKHITVNDGNKWVDRSRKDTVDELKLRASEIIKAKSKMLNIDDEVEAKIKEKIDRFIESYDNEDVEALSNFDEDIHLMITNNSKTVKKTHKIR
jgi:hypothetical protein